jgi:hypothetical protein
MVWRKISACGILKLSQPAMQKKMSFIVITTGNGS